MILKENNTGINSTLIHCPQQCRSSHMAPIHVIIMSNKDDGEDNLMNRDTFRLLRMRFGYAKEDNVEDSLMNKDTCTFRLLRMKFE
jgi:hypothetical protein